ncbi:DUF423 domain-containing protein [Benzoatithermus flavus]|uniref:DUF423 domain-containing protein n=1 Tax=Benzoatithermus flavus TaxID=3108223 RepID=A0ABU8XW90_9PROT
MERHRVWVGMAALCGLLAVAAGAFAAHGLKASGDARAVALVETGSQYQMAHALAMLAYAALGWPSRLPLLCWTIGIVLFAFSLYALAFGAPTGIAVITPVGGTAFLAGWAALAWQAFRARG